MYVHVRKVSSQPCALYEQYVYDIVRVAIAMTSKVWLNRKLQHATAVAVLNEDSYSQYIQRRTAQQRQDIRKKSQILGDVEDPHLQRISCEQCSNGMIVRM